jgi:hypothetical protein
MIGGYAFKSFKENHTTAFVSGGKIVARMVEFYGGYDVGCFHGD